MAEFAIRLAEASDWPKLPLIYEADGYHRAAAGMRQRAAKEIEEFVAGDRILWLAEGAGHPIGTVGLVFRGIDAGRADGTMSANINRLHVVQAQRRRGVGTGLMRAAEGEARLRGLLRLVLDVETGEDSAAARILYETLGYRHTGPGGAENELAMAKELT